MTMKAIAALALLLISATGNAQACFVKGGPSGMLNVRHAPNGLVTGSLENGTLVVIEERRGDWVSITPQAKRSETSVWVRYSDLDCDFVDDVCRKAEREGKTPKQFAEEMLRGTKPVRRTDQQLRNAAFTAATMIVLNEWCRVPLTYCEQVEIIVIGTQVGSDRLNGALNELEEGKKNWAHPNFAYAWRRAYAAKWSGDP
jgi:hypothetical protein